MLQRKIERAKAERKCTRGGGFTTTISGTNPQAFFKRNQNSPLFFT